MWSFKTDFIFMHALIVCNAAFLLLSHALARFHLFSLHMHKCLNQNDNGSVGIVKSFAFSSIFNLIPISHIVRFADCIQRRIVFSHLIHYLKRLIEERLLMETIICIRCKFIEKRTYWWRFVADTWWLDKCEHLIASAHALVDVLYCCVSLKCIRSSNIE